MEKNIMFTYCLLDSNFMTFTARALDSTRKIILNLFFVIAIFVIGANNFSGSNIAFAQTLRAFPEAEGFGAVSVGGRGGVVVKVTNLDPFGPGGLQDALDINAPRIVIFEVSGVIRCDRDLILRYPNIYIAGQTAPGAGITIEGRLNGWNQNLHDVTIRFLRFRPRRPDPQNYSYGDCISLGRSSNCIVDHCSFSWGTDEVFDIYEANNWTVQWSTIEESDPIDNHNYGFIYRSTNSGNVSIHHNLFAHHYRRAPCLSPDRMDLPGDIRNNVIYNVYQCYVHDGARLGVVNIINNYFIHGPSHSRIFMIAAFTDGTYYINGNYLGHHQGDDYGYFGNLTGGESFPSWVQYNYLGTKLNEPVSVPIINTQSAEDAFKAVLDRSGCFPGDRVTRRTIAEVRNGTGSCQRNAPLTPTNEWFLEGLSIRQPPQDTDNDGMPDDWENLNGLNPAVEDHNYIMQTGYTAIEQYVNELATAIINKSINDPAPPTVLRVVDDH